MSLFRDSPSCALSLVAAGSLAGQSLTAISARSPSPQLPGRPSAVLCWPLRRRQGGRVLSGEARKGAQRPLALSAAPPFNPAPPPCAAPAFTRAAGPEKILLPPLSCLRSRTAATSTPCKSRSWLRPSSPRIPWGACAERRSPGAAPEQGQTDAVPRGGRGILPKLRHVPGAWWQREHGLAAGGGWARRHVPAAAMARQRRRGSSLGPVVGRGKRRQRAPGRHSGSDDGGGSRARFQGDGFAACAPCPTAGCRCGGGGLSGVALRAARSRPRNWAENDETTTLSLSAVAVAADSTPLLQSRDPASATAAGRVSRRSAGRFLRRAPSRGSGHRVHQLAVKPFRLLEKRWCVSAPKPLSVPFARSAPGQKSRLVGRNQYDGDCFRARPGAPGYSSARRGRLLHSEGRRAYPARRPRGPAPNCSERSEACSAGRGAEADRDEPRPSKSTGYR